MQNENIPTDLFAARYGLFVCCQGPAKESLEGLAAEQQADVTLVGDIFSLGAELSRAKTVKRVLLEPELATPASAVRLAADARAVNVFM